jgi:uncharacterized protein YaaN involved in tellurite resistance
LSAEDELRKAVEEARRKSEEMVRKVLERVENIVSELARYAREDEEVAKILEGLRSGEVNVETAEKALEELRRKRG